MNQKSILVVDDNLMITDLVQTIVDSAGHRCSKANSGKECLNLLDKAHYDLVLLDIAMPETTGLDVLNSIKQSHKLRDNKVVFFTASSVTEAERQDLIKLGVLDCMRKPFTKADLLQIITKYA